MKHSKLRFHFNKAIKAKWAREMLPLLTKLGCSNVKFGEKTVELSCELRGCLETALAVAMVAELTSEKSASFEKVKCGEMCEYRIALRS